ncbi:protein-L-isoaspartate O-methyltransferase [Actinoplanes sp. DH11]|uniref:protein-L-isoaspartate O-methyltransferase family protein n=1 Tax=Actinoplanes sp. DH11 TaxID=2857011 RepID=UPI001E305921|nr:methyltransferase domain-containing protein [Actinoplanes sp. DH11]
MEDARRHYLDLIRHDGVTLSPDLARAFATVPREVFVPGGFHRRDGRLVLPADPEFLRAVYSNDVLVTKLDGQRPVSSSSQPSLMALMIEALDIRPGQRILEIGAGTGYNAALLATLGAEVTSVESQPDVAERARAALARAGITGVRVETADGYTFGSRPPDDRWPGAAGPPDPAAVPGDSVFRDSVPDGDYDRIIVTVGVAGLAPHWPARLRPGGRIVAPVEHAGMHPVLVAGTACEASVVCPAGFMSAAGPLTARHPGSHPDPPAEPLTGLVPVVGPRWEPLAALAYRDLWFAAGVWHRRVTWARVPETPGTGGAFAGFRDRSFLAVLDDDGTGGAVVLPDGAVLASADRWAGVAVALTERWQALHRPPMRAWRAWFERTGPILVPRTWNLLRP